MARLGSSAFTYQGGSFHLENVNPTGSVSGFAPSFLNDPSALGAALRETGARPLRPAPGRPPRIPYRPLGGGRYSLGGAFALVAQAWAKFPDRNNPFGTWSVPAGWTDCGSGCANRTAVGEPCHGPPRIYPKLGWGFGGGYSCAVFGVPGYPNIKNSFFKDPAAAVGAGATYVLVGEGTTPWTSDGFATLVRAMFTASPNTGPVPVHSPGVRALPLALEAPAPKARPQKMENPSPEPNPKTYKGLMPATGFQFSNDRGPPSRNDDPHEPAPPPRGTKERKFQLGKGGLVGDVFGFLTEVGDGLSCAVSAIMDNQGVGVHSRSGTTHGGADRGVQGSQHRSLHPPKGFPQRAAWVAENFDITNLSMVRSFAECMAVSNLQDMAIGRANSAAGKAYGKATGAPRGPGIKRGPGYGVPTRMR